LGLRRIFDGELSDFTNGVESERGLEVSSVQHSASLELTEQGTQAGAATGSLNISISNILFKFIIT
jgi:serine protease inhibitor